MKVKYKNRIVNTVFFVTNFTKVIDPIFVKWNDLSQNETGSVLFAELVRICKNYNPDTRVVLYVAIYVVSEIPTNGPVEWERQIVARCAKTKLSPRLTIDNSSSSATATATTTASGPNGGIVVATNGGKNENPPTLVLTSLPGSKGTEKDRSRKFYIFIFYIHHIKR